jgi:hypothetical protein
MAIVLYAANLISFFIRTHCRLPFPLSVPPAILTVQRVATLCPTNSIYVPVIRLAPQCIAPAASLRYCAYTPDLCERPTSTEEFTSSHKGLDSSLTARKRF